MNERANCITFSIVSLEFGVKIGVRKEEYFVVVPISKKSN